MNIQQMLQKAAELYQARRLAEGEDLCHQILQRDPAAHQALYLLGVILRRRGNGDAAVDVLARAVNLAPTNPAYQSAYGTALFGRQRYTEAAEAYRKALHDSPGLASAHRGLGRALTQMSELESAMQSLKKALELGTPRGEILADMAVAQRELGLLGEAAESARELVSLQPESAWAHNFWGLIQGDLGDSQGARASFERSIALRPDQPEAHTNLAKIFRDTGQFSKAAETLRNLTKFSPQYVAGHANLGTVLTEVGEVDEAIAAYRQALELRQDDPATRSSLLLCMNFSPKLSRQTVAEEHRRWGMMHGSGGHAEPPPIRRVEPGRPLRVGYVSGDLCRHPVAFFLEPLLQNHDPSTVQVFVYSNVQRPDYVTERMKENAPNWKDVAGLSDEMLSRMIRSDQIDILVDLNGHTGNNRLQAFAARSAPVQVSYLGYPNTTGLATMDYRLTDAIADPPGSEMWYTEKLVRLPHCFLCYAPPADAPLPMRAPPQQSVTFGSFNRLAKLTDEVIGLWARVLAATPNSRLILKESAFREQHICHVQRARLEKMGIDPQRVTIETPRKECVDHLALYNSIDIALDSFPYNGTTTTCEALWMGVPVITLAGEVHASRVSMSILTAIGHAELVAHSPEEYVQLAVNLGGDHARRARLHQNLRGDLERSPLMDCKKFARSVEEAYRQMWADRMAPT